ncbi:MAG TPA: helix-turn-helix domain-containing protein [Solirubrobacteraceae bacterium]|jgi:AcrR family transcriptional regulator|nr:helix-turn-helix domain-containing protein [Solirubrobacteraceae bacterium]
MGAADPSLVGGAVPRPKARERILATAYELFAHRGIQAVGIDAIVEQSGVARQTLYRHFNSKQALVLAFLERREQLWTQDWLRGEVERAATEPEARLLAIFDVFDGWFHSSDFEGCSFINVLLEAADPADPIHRAGAAYLAGIREFIKALAEEAGLSDPDGFARKWHILMKGSIISAGEGDCDAARRARAMAAVVLREQARRPD